MDYTTMSDADLQTEFVNQGSIFTAAANARQAILSEQLRRINAAKVNQIVASIDPSQIASVIDALSTAQSEAIKTSAALGVSAITSVGAP